MKKAIFLSAILIVVFSLVGVSQTKTEKFKVYGNCGMCKDRIEKAATGVEGVSSADWDSETKMIKVSFDKSKTDIHKVHMAIAKVGHDTDIHKAKDEVYNNLAGCCKYDRPTKNKKPEHDHSEHDHSGHHH